MPFDSVILFLGIHPENIIQKYVKFFIHKNVHHRSIQNRKKKKNLGLMGCLTTEE